ncbi:uncharacterized protein LOC117121985 [Anneissia japonica]|uniref:uncharacterized protein LOC117121985 n=1 Tax=Anneissia japonica TaxID=1529436 RepID=UPI0014255BDC|nr:uncharacterized protein LOC117121985 [Anneissia japonica]
MSFLRRLSRTKSVETSENSGKDKDKTKRKSFSGTVPVPKEEKHYVKERRNSEKEKKKSKSESTNGDRVSDLKYPLFYVHYLGRVPTKLEYGHAAIEGPVDQLCKLREKEKLPKLVLTFNPDGLFFREITGPFNRVKKEGMFIYIPLHMVTYGVGSVAHPNVFACVTRTVFDKKKTESSVMFIVHAFLCDKSSVAQKMTYWQLQAYIEAYETLKRKKELRMQRRLRNSSKAETASIETASTTLSSQDGSSASRSTERKRVEDSTFINPKLESQQQSNDSETLQAKKTIETNNGSQLHAQVHEVPSDSTIADDHTHEIAESTSVGATSVGSSKDSAIGDELTSEQTNNDTSNKSLVTGEVNPFSFGKATTPATDSGDILRNRESGDNLDTISVVTMPIDNESVPRDEAFEKRISELNKLMQVDAEDLKSKLIKENPTLVRRLYYGTIDRHGVFHRQGLNLGLDSDNSYA